MELPVYRSRSRRYSPKSKFNGAKAPLYTMFLSSFRRPARLRRRWLRPFLLLLFLVLSLDFIFKIARTAPSTRIPPSTIPPAERERIFIASMHWNNELIIRSHWSAAVLDLVKYYGPENVYISIEESGSWDDTKGALRQLESELEKLNVPRSITLSDRTHKDDCERIPDEGEEGWIRTGREREMELRRIPYLAGIRNKVMERLRSLAEGKDGQPRRTFDKVLWLNDVAFTVSSPHNLRTAQTNTLFLFLDRRCYYFDWNKERRLCCRLLSRFLQTSQLLRYFRPPRHIWSKGSHTNMAIFPGRRIARGHDIQFSSTSQIMLEWHRCFPSRSVLRRATSPFPRYIRQSCSSSPRRVRVLPHTCRQPADSFAWCLAQPQCTSFI